MTPTAKQTRLIWSRACRQFGVRRVHYKNVHRITGLGPALQRVLKLVRFEKLLGNRYVTIWFGGTFWIITPVKIGTGGPWKRALQLFALTHELHHVARAKKAKMRKRGVTVVSGPPAWYYKYLFRKGSRALEEAHGEAAGADMMRLLGHAPNPATMVFDASWMETYLLRRKHAKQAMDTYVRLVAKHKRRQWATSTGAKVAIIVHEVCG